MNNNEISLNVKVYARFRPFNKMENELTKNGLGHDVTVFPDNNTIVLMPESIVYTMDKAFT